MSSATVLYIHGTPSEQTLGGAERGLLSLLGGLDRARFVPIVVLPDSGLFYRALREGGIDAEVLSIPAWRKAKALPSLPLALLRLRRLIMSRKIDLVCANDFWFAPISSLAATLCGRASISHVRVEIEPRRIRQYRLDKVDYLIAASNRIRETITGSGVSPQKVGVVYSGLAPPKDRPEVDVRTVKQRLGIPAGHRVVGTVAHLLPRKGIEFFIGAARRVVAVRPDVSFIVVGGGDGPYATSLTSQARDVALQGRLVFLGYQAEVFPILSAIDIFVLPSVSEGFGIALLEAMATRKAVVATAVGGIPEVVVDGATGVVVPPRDSERMAGAILTLLDNPEMADAMGRRGCERVETEFTLEAEVERITTIYSRVMASALGRDG